MTDAELVDLIAERFYTTAGHARPWAEGYPPTRDRCRARARAILPLVRGVMADAWDEGAYVGYDDARHDGDTPNPYRPAQLEEVTP